MNIHHCGNRRVQQAGGALLLATLILILLILYTSPRLSRPFKLINGLYYLLPILQCNFALGEGIVCLHRCCGRFNTQTCGTLGGVSVSSALPSPHVVSVAIALSASSSTYVAQALSKYSRDLTQAARDGKLDPVIGRDDEIRRTVQILSRRTKNNPILLGEPGAVIESMLMYILQYLVFWCSYD